LLLIGILPKEVLTLMQGAVGERWRELCAKAAVEQDPEKLLELTREISRLLDEKQERLLQQRKGEGQSAG
jgi:hypothetical protein